MPREGETRERGKKTTGKNGKACCQAGKLRQAKGRRAVLGAHRRSCGGAAAVPATAAARTRRQVHGSYHEHHGSRGHLVVLQYRLEQGPVAAIELPFIPACRKSGSKNFSASKECYMQSNRLLARLVEKH